MLNHPWFRPLWRRLLISGLCTAWAVAEAAFGSSPWDWIAFALAAYAIWGFFVTDTYRTPRGGDRTTEDKR